MIPPGIAVFDALFSVVSGLKERAHMMELVCGPRRADTYATHEAHATGN